MSAATVNKRANGNLAAGSYHAGAEGPGVDGVIYPVFVPDMAMLDGDKEVADGRSVEITTTAKGKTSTTVYEGKDPLFEAAEQSFPGVPAEAWYAPALAWAAEKGLVSGEGFAPAAPCTRAEIVSLLYRAAN